MKKEFTYDICIVGFGHIGSPLGILFASKGLKVLAYDTNINTINTFKEGKLPFFEKDCEKHLHIALKNNNLFLTTNSYDISNSKVIILTIGTEVDKFQNSIISDIIKCVDELPITNDHLLILRSTVSPGVTKYVENHLHKKNIHPLIAFCPERVVQGNVIEEIQYLPQIISGTSEEAKNQASKLFSHITDNLVFTNDVMNAEFAKLISNAYQYIQFAATNEFYEMTTSAGLDYNEVLNIAKQDYKRLKDLPSAGFASGPCLLKDAIQLSAYANGNFNMGQAAIRVNEGLPAFMIEQLSKKYDLTTKTIGLLGMAFKADNDDIRTSLSYKMKKILKYKANVKSVLTTDPLVSKSIDPDLLPLEEVIERSDILIVCVNHSAYKDLDFKGKEVINIWK